MTTPKAWHTLKDPRLWTAEDWKTWEVICERRWAEAAKRTAGKPPVMTDATPHEVER